MTSPRAARRSSRLEESSCDFREDVEIWTAVAAHLGVKRSSSGRARSICVGRIRRCVASSIARCPHSTTVIPSLACFPRHRSMTSLPIANPEFHRRPSRERPLMSVLTEVPGDLRSAQDEILDLRRNSQQSTERR